MSNRKCFGKGKDKALTPTHIVVVMDRSGSMLSTRDDALGGFNSMLKEQQELGGQAAMTLILFDHEHLTVFAGRDLKDCQPLTAEEYVPRGSTSLMDSLGRGISEAQEILKEHQVLVVVITDGHENTSQEYRKETIKALVEERTAAGWTFLYLGSDLSTFADAGDFGFQPKNVAAYTNDADGTRGAYQGASFAVMSLRTTGNAGGLTVKSASASGK